MLTKNNNNNVLGPAQGLTPPCIQHHGVTLSHSKSNFLPSSTETFHLIEFWFYIQQTPEVKLRPQSRPNQLIWSQPTVADLILFYRTNSTLRCSAPSSLPASSVSCWMTGKGIPLSCRHMGPQSAVCTETTVLQMNAYTNCWSSITLKQTK